MRTMINSCLLTVSLVLNFAVAVADEKSHCQAAEALLKAINIEKAMETVMGQMLAILKQNPQIGPYQDVLKRFLSKHFSLYQTPAGKKIIEKLPQLTGKGGQLAVARVQANQAELQQMIEEEKNKQGKSN